MAALYDVSIPAINQHLKRIFSDNELEESSVLKQYLTTAADGKGYRIVQDRLFESDFDRMMKRLPENGDKQ